MGNLIDTWITLIPFGVIFPIVSKNLRIYVTYCCTVETNLVKFFLAQRWMFPSLIAGQSRKTTNGLKVW